MKFQDLTGRKFGRLTVLKTYRENNLTYCDCKCICGNISKIRASNLKSNHTKSCGCLHQEMRVKSNITHGKSNTRLWRIYHGIKARCINKNSTKYYYYGARGIKVCDEWINNFENFYNWAINNGYKDDLTIDRIDVNGNYEPNNCRWIDLKQQTRNKRTTHYLTYKNKTHCITEWEEILKFPKNLIHQRITKYHWDIEKALNTPPKNYNKN